MLDPHTPPHILNALVKKAGFLEAFKGCPLNDRTHFSMVHWIVAHIMMWRVQGVIADTYYPFTLKEGKDGSNRGYVELIWHVPLEHVVLDLSKEV